MPRVLVVSHFFPPHGGGGVQRVLGWTRHLPSFGWDVTVLAAGPKGFWIEDPSLLARVPAATEVLRVDAPTGVALWRGLAGRDRAAFGVRTDRRVKSLARFFLLPDSYRAWAGPATREGRTRLARGGIDVVLSTSPPETAHLVGGALVRAAGLPWVADFRDPWVALHYRKPPTPLHAALHRAMERRVLENADRVLCASQTHAEAVAHALGARGRERVVFLPNGVELDADGPEARAPHAPPRAAGRARIVATGSLVEVPALEHFLAALARLQGAEPGLAARLEVVLAGPHEERLRSLVRGLGLDLLVRFTGPLPHAEARALQRSADALLLVRNEGPGYEAMVPGKLYEYLDARRPLVAALGESEAARLVREAGGVVVPPTDGAGALRAALAALVHAPGTEGAPAPDEAAIARLLERRSRRALAGELARVLDGVRRA